MIGAKDGLRVLEAIRLDDTAADHDRSLAAGMQAILHVLIAEQKKLNEIESVMKGMNRTLNRLQGELIDEHNRDIAALTAGLTAMEDLVASMRRSA
ncbi:MAG: hypothetical protein AAGJ28_26110 [Pseudomonadota bacterium]